MTNLHPMGQSSLVNRKMTRSISAYLSRSILEWWMFEPHLESYAGICEEELLGAFLSVAVEIARLAVKNIKIPNARDGEPSFVLRYCHHQYHFPGAPPEFIAGEILKRLNHEEWAALATAFIVPTWIEQAVIDWAQSQSLTLKSVEESE